MIKTNINNLYQNNNFTVEENREVTTFTSKKLLEPNIIIDNTEYKTIVPISKIIIIKNHILQTYELELKSEWNNLLLHTNLDGFNIENITIKYNIMKNN